MPAKQKGSEKSATLKKLEENLKTIEEFESNFILQKAELKESVENYEKTKKLIQICRDGLKKYMGLMGTIEASVTGNNSREREAKKILAKRKTDLINYKARLESLKETRKSELYGSGMFKKNDLEYCKEQLQERIKYFDLQKANDLNIHVEKYISEKLIPSKRIISRALAETPKIKISTDNLEKLSEILTNELNDLTKKYNDFKAKHPDMQTTAEWILSWGKLGLEALLKGGVGGIGSYLVAGYILPNLPALYRYIFGSQE